MEKVKVTEVHHDPLCPFCEKKLAELNGHKVKGITMTNVGPKSGAMLSTGRGNMSFAHLHPGVLLLFGVAALWRLRAAGLSAALGAVGFGVLLHASPVCADHDVTVHEQRAHRASIHQRELEHWHARQAAGWVAQQDRGDRAPVPPRSVSAAPRREIHGYHPYWMETIYTSYDWSLLSTVAFFALEIDGDGNIIEFHGWPWSGLIATAHANGVRTLATAVLFSSAELDLLLSSTTKRQTAITNLVNAVTSAGADGINVDFEGVPGSRKQDLVTFVGDLRSALDAAVANAYLSIATPAVDWNNAFDYDELAARCDHLAVMSYDYHWSGSSTTGPVAPLTGWGPYNVGWTIQDYLAWGAPPEKILLGAPYYGYRWQAASEQPGAATLASGVARTFVQAVSEAEQSEELWDEASSTPWYRFLDTNWSQGWYDNATSLTSKYNAVWDDSLGGVSVWALGYDGSRPELWAALADAFAPTSVAVGEGAVLPEASFVSLTPNPFRASMCVRLSTPATSRVRLNVYDVRGQRIRSLLHDTVGRDVHEIVWNGRDDRGRASPAGVYWIRLETPSSKQSVRVVRLR